MHEKHLCSHCAAWSCRADDAWCGYCGWSVAKLQLDVKPSVLHLGFRPPKLFVKVTNLSCAEVTIGRVDMPDWISFKAEQFARLMPGSSQAFLAQAHTEVINEPKTADIVLRTSVGNAKAIVMVIQQEPLLTCVPSVIEVWPTENINSKVALSIRPKAGGLYVRGARVYSGEQELAVNDLEERSLATPVEGAIVEIQVDNSKLALGLHPATLRVTFDGPHGPEKVSVPISIRVRRPPQLRWAAEYQPPQIRHQTDRQNLQFVLHNQSPDGRDSGFENADLIIRSITLIPPKGSGITVQDMSHFPASVPGGMAHTANFEIDLSSLSGEKATNVDFTLAVHTNLPVLRRTVSLRVEPLPIYEGILAIDFGSSNTCCAVSQPGAALELIPLDGEHLVLPTIVRYVDLTTSPVTIEIGSTVQDQAAESEEIAASVARGLKRTLRVPRQEIDIRPDNPRRWTTRKATVAAADYLQAIRHLAEVRKSVVFHDFVLTHPVRCPLRQHHRLRNALSLAFGASQNTVSYMSEPLAALIPLMQRKAEQTIRKPYTVASFDLGGGTTDVALVFVRYSFGQQEQVEIHPEILSCAGTDFGGEDLTLYLMAQIQQRCRSILKLEEPSAILIVEHLDAAAVLDIRRNQWALREAAEQFKVSRRDPLKGPRQILLRIQESDGKTRNYPFDFSAIAQHAGTNLAVDFVSHTKVQIKQIALLLRDAVTLTKSSLDVIQLTGQTALLPVVGEAIQEMFPGVQIDRPNDPKECVVKGACLSRSMRLGKIRLVLTDTINRLTSTIGIFGTSGSFFIPVLTADTVVPAAGLHRVVQHSWSGADIVLWESLHAEQRPIEYSSVNTMLEKLGTWIPERSLDPVESGAWGLRLSIVEFNLTLVAVSPAGELIRFRQINESGD